MDKAKRSYENRSVRRFHNGVESIDKHKEPEAVAECNLESEAKRRFQREMECGRKSEEVADRPQGIA